jgi:PEGA domain
MAGRQLAVWACVAALTLSGAAAWAAPKTTPASQEAATRYGRGIGLYKDGDYSAALAEFRAAYRALPSWEVLYNIGLCERRLYKYGDSVRNLEAYLSQGGSRVPKDRRDAVARELSEIRALTAVVTITVTGDPADVTIDGEAVGSSPFKEPFLLGPGKKVFKATREGENPAEKSEEIVSGTQVTIVLSPRPKVTEPAVLTMESSPKGAVISVDGKLAGTAPLTVTLEPGGHLVVAEAPGHQTYSQEVALAEGQKRELSIVMDAEVGARRRPFPVAGLIVSGVGLAGIGGSIGLNVSAQASAREVTELFQNGGTWDAAMAKVEKSGQSAEAWSIVVGVAGGVALTTGVILTLITVTSESEEVPAGGTPAEEAPVEGAGLFLTPLPGGGVYGGLGFKW